MPNAASVPNSLQSSTLIYRPAAHFCIVLTSLDIANDKILSFGNYYWCKSTKQVICSPPTFDAVVGFGVLSVRKTTVHSFTNLQYTHTLQYLPITNYNSSCFGSTTLHRCGASKWLACRTNYQWQCREFSFGDTGDCKVPGAMPKTSDEFLF